MKITEKHVEELWLGRKLEDIRTISGDSCTVMYPGRLSTDGGCDFHDAVFTINNQKIHGDIEVHVNNSYWYRHRHHLDPRYNSVALHVVLNNDNDGLPARLENGTVIPTVCLNRSEKSGKYGYNFQCPYSLCLDKNRLSYLIAIAGETSFKNKSLLYREKMRGSSELQVIYSYCARALGYSKNADYFYSLAQKLPVNKLEPVLKYDMAAARALILGTAGMLPSQRTFFPICEKDDEMELLEHKWNLYGRDRGVIQNHWNLFRIRPCNAPARRLIALAYLAKRLVAGDFTGDCINQILRCAENSTFAPLEDLMAVSPDQYWICHQDFARPMKKDMPLIGSGRMRTIIINVVLPFMHALASRDHDQMLKHCIMKVYGKYRNTEDNQIIRYMTSTLNCRGLISGAVRQQGLLYIYKEYCKYKDCDNCLINVRRYED
jgi:hypothetical protein